MGLLALVCAGLSTAPASSPQRAPQDARSAHLSIRVIDGHGQPLIARVRIAPRTWAERVRLGHWRDTQVVSPQEGVEMNVRPGDYRMLVSHGLEWSLIDEPIRVRAGERIRYVRRLHHQVSLPDWKGADLHVHTAHSEDAKERGGVGAQDLHAEGVHMVAVTDHNRVGDLGAAFDSVKGAELTTWAPEVGHFNAFPLREVPSFRATTPARLFAELARNPEVFVQINHPRLDDHIAYFTLGGFDGERFADPSFHLDVDGLEVWNGYDLARPSAVQQVVREWRGWVARGHRLTATGGSDSHGSSGHLPGYPRTYVRAHDAGALSRALKAGQAFVTNGPLLRLSVQGREAGENLTVSSAHNATVTADLTVLAPDWMRVERAEIWVDQELAFHAEIPAQRSRESLTFSARVTLPVDGAHTIHAVASGGEGLDALLGRDDVEPLAFTNPIYLTRAPDSARVQSAPD